MGRELQKSTEKWRMTFYYCWSCHAIKWAAEEKEIFFAVILKPVQNFTVKILSKEHLFLKFMLINNNIVTRIISSMHNFYEVILTQK